MLSLQLVGS